MAKRVVSIKSRERAQAKKRAASEIKHKAAQLKKRGFIYQNKSLRNATVTGYMRKRVRELEGLLDGTLVFVETPKGLAPKYKYKDSIKPITKRGRGHKRSGVVAPAPLAGHYAVDIRRGLLANIVPLGDGHVLEKIEMPVNVRSYHDFKEWVDSGEPDRLKFENEYFAMRLNGFGTYQALPNSETLAQYLERYEFLEEYSDAPCNPSDETTPVTLELFRVWPPDAWENKIRLEREEYEASPEYQAKLARFRERKKLNRRIRRYKQRNTKGYKPKEGVVYPTYKPASQLTDEQNEKRRAKWAAKKRRQRARK